MIALSRLGQYHPSRLVLALANGLSAPILDLGSIAAIVLIQMPSVDSDASGESEDLTLPLAVASPRVSTDSPLAA